MQPLCTPFTAMFVRSQNHADAWFIVGKNCARRGERVFRLQVVSFPKVKVLRGDPV